MKLWLAYGVGIIVGGVVAAFAMSWFEEQFREPTI